MGEWSEYFEDHPEEDPANQVNGVYNPEEAARRRAARAQADSVAQDSAALRAKIEQMGRDAKAGAKQKGSLPKK